MIDDDLPLIAYGRTAGFVNQPASRDRAQKEAASGVASQRAMLVLRYLQNAPEGMTWRELGAALNLHHGQISGVLSNLHKSGLVFMLRQQRNRCHPYAHSDLRGRFADADCIDAPVQTRTKQRLQELEELLHAINTAIINGDVHDLQVIKKAHALQINAD